MQKSVYLEWVKTRTRARYEISGSGVIPVHIDELPEARDAIDFNDFNLYGYRPLLQALAERYQVTTGQVVTTQGTSMANYLAMAAVIGRGDEVLVEEPAYEPLLQVPKLLGAKVRRFKRAFRNGFRIDLNDLAQRAGDRTRLIVLTNPHNPSGVLEPEDVLRDISGIAEKVGAYVLVDEVYMDFLFERLPRSAVHLGQNLVVTCSLTKVYGFDGLRCGWVLAPAKLAEAMWRLQDLFGVNGAIPAEKAAVVVFAHLDRFVERTRKIIEANRPLVDEFMAAHQDFLKWAPPDAGPVCFPRLRDGKAEAFVERVRRDFEVGLIPGRFFERPRHFRLGFGGATDNLQAGLRGLSAGLK